MGLNLKKMAAEAAMDWIKPGMRLGLGTGSTANELVLLLAEAVRDGLDVICVPTSQATATLAAEHGIALTTLDETPELDLTIDGADEIGPDLMLIKGGGGAHLREKIVAYASHSLLIIADESKRVDQLGCFPLPLEVVPFGLEATRRGLLQVFEEQGLSGSLTRRERQGKLFMTDSGNAIFDASMGLIAQPEKLARSLNRVPGLVEHGLFLNMATSAIIAGEDGVKVLNRE